MRKVQADRSDSFGRKPSALSNVTNSCTKPKASVSAKPIAVKSRPTTILPKASVSPQVEESESKRLGLTVSKKSYADLKKREEELDRENSQLKITNNRLTHKVQAQEKKFNQRLEEKDYEIKTLLARIAEIEQQRENITQEFQKLNEKHNDTTDHLRKCQTKLEILNINPAQLRDHEKINSELKDFENTLGGIAQTLEADKQTINEGITKASSILISLGLIQETSQDAMYEEYENDEQ